MAVRKGVGVMCWLEMENFILGVATANMLFEYRPRTGLVGLVNILSVQQDFAHDDRHMMLLNKMTLSNMR